MRLLYDLGILLYNIAIWLVAPFNHKAKLMIKGRYETFKKLSYTKINTPVIWVHAASLGEFEQGRPLIEAIKKNYPNKKILLTFFSPSGYEVRKNYSFVDYVMYLPSDTPWNARKFISAIKPEMAFFIKYEFWFHYLKILKQSKIPVYGVSVIFRSHQPFFKWYGKWFKQILGFYTHLFLQDQKSLALLNKVGFNHATVCGDTRFDRVAEIAAAAKDIEIAKLFSKDRKVIVAGSTWPKDEAILAKFINRHPDINLIIAPHEVDDSHIIQLESLFKVPLFKYTQAPKGVEEFRVMVINTIGLLSSLYQYGDFAYIGGGFGKGIHNTLEAATFGKPVIFGPNYKRFKEANDLIDCRGGFSIHDYESFNIYATQFYANPDTINICGECSMTYVKSMQGATNVIMEKIF